MYRYLLFAAALALLAPGTSGPSMAAASPPTAVSCPKILMFRSIDGIHYAVAAGALLTSNATIDWKLYSVDAEPEMPQINVGTNVRWPFRADDLPITNPRSKPRIGLSIETADGCRDSGSGGAPIESTRGQHATAGDNDLTTLPPTHCVAMRDDGKNFIFESGVSEHASVNLELVTGTATYRARLPDVTIDRKVDDATGTTYRSGPIALTDLPSEPIEAYAVSGGPPGESCEANRTIVRGSDAKAMAAKLGTLRFGNEAQLVIIPNKSSNPTATCATRFSDAHVLTQGIIHDDTAMLGGESGRAWIMVDVAADGSLSAAHVFHSSGHAWLDKAALESASHSTYAPMIYDCVAVPEAYEYVVEFWVNNS